MPRSVGASVQPTQPSTEPTDVVGAEDSTGPAASEEVVDQAEFIPPTDKVPDILPGTDEVAEPEVAEEVIKETVKINPLWPVGTKFERAENGSIYFSAPAGIAPPKPIETKLQNIEYLGELYPEEGVPFVLFSALPCQGCNDRRALYSVRADGNDPQQFTFPGKIRDAKNGSTVFEGQTFYGSCVAGKPDMLITYQNERVDRRRHLQQSAFVATVQGGRMSEEILTSKSPRMREVIKQVSKKKCFEVKGFTRNTVTYKVAKQTGKVVFDD